MRCGPDRGLSQQHSHRHFCGVPEPQERLVSQCADVRLGNGTSLNGGVKWFTAQDFQYVNPATGASSAAPAAYTIGSSCSQCLMQRCAADGPYYHIMVTQAGTTGAGCVLEFYLQRHSLNGGPHGRWAAAALRDGIVMAPDSEGGYTPYLAINNRRNDGTGQGWAAGFSVML